MSKLRQASLKQLEARLESAPSDQLIPFKIHSMDLTLTQEFKVLPDVRASDIILLLCQKLGITQPNVFHLAEIQVESSEHRNLISNSNNSETFTKFSEVRWIDTNTIPKMKFPKEVSKWCLTRKYVKEHNIWPDSNTVYFAFAQARYDLLSFPFPICEETLIYLASIQVFVLKTENEKKNLEELISSHMSLLFPAYLLQTSPKSYWVSKLERDRWVPPSIWGEKENWVTNAKLLYIRSVYSSIPVGNSHLFSVLVTASIFFPLPYLHLFLLTLIFNFNF